MAFIVAGAAALGIAGLGFYVNPGRAEADELANNFFRKPYDRCSPTEKQAIDLAHGIPKLEKLRDGFQSLFPKPKAKKNRPKKKQERRTDDQQLQDQQSANAEQTGYALHDDPDVLAAYPVHEDTADPDQRYLADFNDLKKLAPFDIETESLEDAGTYDIEEFLQRNQRFPETFTLPRQLGGAATSANLLINKLTEGRRAGVSENYILPGHSPVDHVHPPTDEDLGTSPDEVKDDLQAAVDYRLGAGKYDKGVPESVQRALAFRRLEEQQRAEEGYPSDEEEEDEDYSDEDDYSDEEEEEDEEEVVQRPPAASSLPSKVQQVREPSESEEYDEDDEDEDY